MRGLRSKVVMHRILPRTLVFAVLSSLPVAQQPSQDPSRLDAQRVSGGEFTAQRFGPARWLDGTHYATLEVAADRSGLELVRYDAASGEREVLLPAARLALPGRPHPLIIEDYQFSPDGGQLLVFTNSERVWRRNTRGDYYVVDLAGTSAPRKLGSARPASSLMFAKFAPQGDRVAYVSEHDLYVEDVATGEWTRLTEDGSATIINGTFDWVYEEEFDCRDGFRWSPDGTRIAYWQLDASGVGEFLMIDNLSELYSRVVPVQFPLAGTTNSACRVGVVPAGGGDTVWMQTPGTTRETYIPRMEWHTGGDELMLQWLPRSQQELRVLAANAADGAVRVVCQETDAAYVDVRDDFHWQRGGAGFLWTSDRDGWRHAYLEDWSGRAPIKLEMGAFDIVDLYPLDTQKEIYFTASPKNATQNYLFLWSSGHSEQVTPGPDQGVHRIHAEGLAEQPGWHDYQISPDGSWAIHTYSHFDSPPIIDLVRLPSHQRVRVLVDNQELRARYARIENGDNEFFRVAIEDGVELDGWAMYPADFDPNKSWPVLFHVYSEPWSQTVKDTWSLGHHLFHRWLTQQGYVVMSLDVHGTPAPRGRAWRKAAYQKIGIITSREWDQGVRALCAEHPWMDRSRLAIWGWSGGGSMTLNMLFRYPDLFAAGMSVAPVTDIRLYDTIYQERYTGDPRRFPEVYRECSPITFAGNLTAKLLLVHGTGDDNVHYQNSERLIDELIAHGKHFEFLAYPNRTHAIVEGKGTRQHLYGSLADFLVRRVVAGPK